jgi:hypothetical protein
MKAPEMADDRPVAMPGMQFVWIAGAVAVLASAPALFARGLIADDWSGYYVFWTEGPSGFARWMIEVAHAGYSIPMLSFFYLWEDKPNVIARIVGLGCHCLCGLLLYRILAQSPRSRCIAAVTTALFLVTPFYAVRLTLNAAYDFFLLFYLLSYLLMDSPSRPLRWLAPISLLLSLSLETLIALEPLRLVFAYHAGERWTKPLARLMPFWVVVAIVIVLRLTILEKSGHYAGQYAPVHDIGIALAALSSHLDAFPRALSYACTQGLAFLGRLPSTMLVLVAVALSGMFGASALRTSWLLKSPSSVANTVLLTGLGVAIAVIGALPYALVGVYGDITRVETRLLFPSQFGALVLLAVVIQCLPLGRLRAAITGGAIAMFGLSMAHDAKWLLFDGLVTSDLQRQTRAALLSDPGPKVVELKIQASAPLFFRSRCLGANDMNAAQDILRDRSRPRSFIYSDNCGDFTNLDIVPRERCPISYLDGYPCPARREIWLYNPAPGIAPLDDIGIFDLISAVVSPSSSADGGRGKLVKLTGNRESQLERAEYRPPCDRSGAKASLWLLAIPVPNCEYKLTGD